MIYLFVINWWWHDLLSIRVKEQKYEVPKDIEKVVIALRKMAGIVKMIGYKLQNQLFENYLLTQRKQLEKYMYSAHLLEQSLEPCIHELFSHLLPEQEFKSIHDLFNAQKFYKFMLATLTQQTKSKLNWPDLGNVEDSDQSYTEMKVDHFRKILARMRECYEILGLEMKVPVDDKSLEKMVKNYDMHVLKKLLENIFELILKNQQILEFITTLNEEMQTTIMEFIKNGGSENLIASQGSEEVYSSHSLKIFSNLNCQGNPESRLQELEHILAGKEEELKYLNSEKMLLKEELEELRSLQEKKEQEIETYKKRLVSYEEIDQLMLEKDEEIFRLQEKLSRTQLDRRLRESELASENRLLSQKLQEVEGPFAQISTKYEKQKNLVEQLHKQREESQTSMKKVINNLKEKNKLFSEKINELQKELIEVNFEKEVRDKELQQLRSSINPIDSNKFDRYSSPRSPTQGEDFLEGLEEVRGGNYSKLGEQLSVDLQKTDFEDDLALLDNKESNKRLTELLQENYNLKQQLVQSSGDPKHLKGLQDQISKQKKKINILKRRNDEIDQQRREEIDIMVGVLEQTYSVCFGQSKEQ